MLVPGLSQVWGWLAEHAGRRRAGGSPSERCRQLCSHVHQLSYINCFGNFDCRLRQAAVAICSHVLVLQAPQAPDPIQSSNVHCIETIVAGITMLDTCCTHLRCMSCKPLARFNVNEPRSVQTNASRSKVLYSRWLSSSSRPWVDPQVGSNAGPPQRGCQAGGRCCAASCQPWAGIHRGGHHKASSMLLLWKRVHMQPVLACKRMPDIGAGPCRATSGC